MKKVSSPTEIYFRFRNLSMLDCKYGREKSKAMMTDTAVSSTSLPALSLSVLALCNICSFKFFPHFQTLPNTFVRCLIPLSFTPF